MTSIEKEISESFSKFIDDEETMEIFKKYVLPICNLAEGESAVKNLSVTQRTKIIMALDTMIKALKTELVSGLVEEFLQEQESEESDYSEKDGSSIL